LRTFIKDSDSLNALRAPFTVRRTYTAAYI
jgi:hypothetical protein